MQEMTSIERVHNLHKRLPVDRIALSEHFWGDTHKLWTQQGHIKEGESLFDHFKFDIQDCGLGSVTAKIDFKPEVVEETEETSLVRDGNGALLRRHKLHDSTPEHVDFLVKDRAGWEEHIKPYLAPDPRRLNVEAYRRVKAEAAASDRFFAMSHLLPFEIMHLVCGHENLLINMAIDPDFVKDMVSTYTDFSIDMMETMFAQEGKPDGVWLYEDMGFKAHAFMSLDMYREIMLPGHKRAIDFCHSKGLPVMFHSCGMVESLVPGMLEAGIDCLQAIEVKAGMDLLKLYRDYGDRLSFMGGVDVRVLYSNDKCLIEAELEKKVPVVKGNHGFMLHSDHSIPNTVNYDSYEFFVRKGLALGQYN